ncbi:MAG: hypothetical protein QGG29_08695 [Prochlorococcaceae cyanobacterium ETNP18_MAG_17]|nr:hypothetical protein [Prochlorococcaceae cyanobacterium ETNP18_MAG_17]
MSGTSAETNALKVGAAAEPETGPAKTTFAARVAEVLMKAPGPPMASIVVALPPEPPVPTPMYKVWSTSLNASSEFSSVAGAPDAPEALRLILMVLATGYRVLILT